MNKSWSYLGIVVLMLAAVGMASAQVKTSLPNKQPTTTSAHLIEATRKYKADSEDLRKLQEDEINKASQKLEQLRLLVADGLVAKNELAAAEESLAALQATLEATRQKIGDSDQMIAEIQSEELRNTKSVAQAGLINKTRSLVRPTVLRYNGRSKLVDR